VAGACNTVLQAIAGRNAGARAITACSGGRPHGMPLAGRLAATANYEPRAMEGTVLHRVVMPGRAARLRRLRRGAPGVG